VRRPKNSYGFPRGFRTRLKGGEQSLRVASSSRGAGQDHDRFTHGDIPLHKTTNANISSGKTIGVRSHLFLLAEKNVPERTAFL